jgi:hypothetical protein
MQSLFCTKFHSFSPGQKAIHLGITWGFMKTPGFHPSLSKGGGKYDVDEGLNTRQKG